MNTITLTDGELALIENALVDKTQAIRKEARNAFAFGDIETIQRKLDELRQLERLSNRLPVKI